MKKITYLFGKPLHISGVQLAYCTIIADGAEIESGHIQLCLLYMGHSVNVSIYASIDEFEIVKIIMTSNESVESKLQYLYEKYENVFWAEVLQWCENIANMAAMTKQNTEPFSNN